MQDTETLNTILNQLADLIRLAEPDSEYRKTLERAFGHLSLTKLYNMELTNEII